MLRCATILFLLALPAHSLDIVTASVEAEATGKGQPSLYFQPTRQLEWERIIRAAATDIDFDRPNAEQLARMKEEPGSATLVYCVTRALDPALRQGAYFLIATRGISPVRPTGMRICASFPPAGATETRASVFWGEIAAAVPSILQNRGSGFVIHTAGDAPVAVSSAGRSFEAATAKQGRKTTLTCTYAERGHAAVRTTVDAEGRLSLSSWHIFRLPQGLYAFTAWKGEESLCGWFYSVFEIAGELREILFTGDDCDV